MKHVHTHMAHIMNTRRLIASLGLAMACGAQAQTPPANDQAAPPRQAPAAATPAATLADGEVRKIDQAQGKVTLKHGPITNLDMPGMTMVLKVADPKLLENLKVGDKVRFAAERVNGAIVVTAIEKAP